MPYSNSLIRPKSKITIKKTGLIKTNITQYFRMFLYSPQLRCGNDTTHAFVLFSVSISSTRVYWFRSFPSTATRLSIFVCHLGGLHLWDKRDCATKDLRFKQPIQLLFNSFSRSLTSALFWSTGLSRYVINYNFFGLHGHANT